MTRFKCKICDKILFSHGVNIFHTEERITIVRSPDDWMLEIICPDCKGENRFTHKELRFCEGKSEDKDE